MRADFKARNAERLALIDKDFAGGLTAAEKERLRSLTAFVDGEMTRAYPMDLSFLNEVCERATRLRLRIEKLVREKIAAQQRGVTMRVTLARARAACALAGCPAEPVVTIAHEHFGLGTVRYDLCVAHADAYQGGLDAAGIESTAKEITDGA